MRLKSRGNITFHTAVYWIANFFQVIKHYTIIQLYFLIRQIAYNWWANSTYEHRVSTMSKGHVMEIEENRSLVSHIPFSLFRKTERHYKLWDLLLLESRCLQWVKAWAAQVQSHAIKSLPKSAMSRFHFIIWIHLKYVPLRGNNLIPQNKQTHLSKRARVPEPV